MKTIRGMQVLALAAAVAAGFTVPASAESGPRDGRASLHGAWTTKVSLLVQCGSPAVLRTLDALNNFHAGGTATEVGAGVPPSLRTPSVGTWYRIGRRTYASSFVFFRFDPSGLHLGSQEVTRVIRVAPDGMSYDADATTTIRDRDGNVLGPPGCAVEKGTRFG